MFVKVLGPGFQKETFFLYSFRFTKVMGSTKDIFGKKTFVSDSFFLENNETSFGFYVSVAKTESNDYMRNVVRDGK